MQREPVAVAGPNPLEVEGQVHCVRIDRELRHPQIGGRSFLASRRIRCDRAVVDQPRRVDGQRPSRHEQRRERIPVVRPTDVEPAAHARAKESAGRRADAVRRRCARDRRVIAIMHVDVIGAGVEMVERQRIGRKRRTDCGRQVEFVVAVVIVDPRHRSSRQQCPENRSVTVDRDETPFARAGYASTERPIENRELVDVNASRGERIGCVRVDQRSQAMPNELNAERALRAERRQSGGEFRPCVGDFRSRGLQTVGERARPCDLDHVRAERVDMRCHVALPIGHLTGRAVRGEGLPPMRDHDRELSGIERLRRCPQGDGTRRRRSGRKGRRCRARRGRARG